MAPVEDGALTVTVSFSPRAGEVDEAVVRLPPGATAGDAVVASGVQCRHPEIDPAVWPIGVWGERCSPSRLLCERDRVELYRPLTVDPKEARRLRYRATMPAAKARRDRGRQQGSTNDLHRDRGREPALTADVCSDREQHPAPTPGQAKPSR